MFIENNKNDLLTLEDLCNRLMVSETVAYRLLRSGAIRAFKIGSLWRIPESAIHEYVEKECGKRMEYK